MKRTPDDICLLCKSRKSVKTKSHIINMLDYMLITCANFPTDTFGGIAALNSKKAHLLCVNKFLIYVEKKVKGEREGSDWNQDRDLVKITYWDFENYTGSFLNPLFRKFSQLRESTL